MLEKYILYYTISFFAIYVIDKIGISILSKKAQWFQLHFIINMLISYTSWNEAAQILINPNKAKEITNNYITCALAFSLHLYHVLFFKLSTVDKLHHVSSVFFVTPLGLYFNKKVLSLHYFFGTGVPGGIEYLLLSLVKHDKLSVIKQKQCSSYLNAFMRMPGGVLASFLTFADAINSSDIIFTIVGIIIAIISFLNVTIFGKMAIENYIERRKLQN